jgi:uncharacterized membrane protein
MEAFSDGVIAIIITIMVLELRAPHDTSLAGLRPLVPVFGSYVMSFIFIGIYWSNHHHLLHVTEHIDGRALWANLHLLFWLSLIPFVTAWMGENNFAQWPVALYGCVLLLSAIAYTILVRILLAAPGNELLASALGSDFKGKISMAIYALAIPSPLCDRGSPGRSTFWYQLRGSYPTGALSGRSVRQKRLIL